jgi:VanZ family protein
MVRFSTSPNFAAVASHAGTTRPNSEHCVTTVVERLFQLLFWMAVSFAFVMASLPQPPSLPGNPSDKQLHMLAFLVLASLAASAFPRVSLFKIFLGLAAFGGAIEIVQAVPALGREASWLDWLADLVAAAAALILAAITRAALRYVLSAGDGPD